MAEQLFVTHAGEKKLNQKIKLLEEKRIEQTRIIGEAAAQDTDLPENTLFKQAREIVMFQIPQERKVLLEKLSRIVIISADSELLLERPEDEVWIGSIVVIDAFGDEETWTIVGHDEGDPDNYSVSYNAPMAAAMLGKKAGEICRVNDRFTFTIKSVSRNQIIFEDNTEEV